MAIYTTFFLARLEALAEGFPGWKPPLPAPVQREVRNPFTGKVQIVTSREPAWPEVDGAATPLPASVVVPIRGDYATVLESRLPPFVSRCAHWATKGWTEVELGPLATAAGLTSTFEIPLYAPPSASALLQTLPEGFGRWSESEVGALASRWAAAMSTPHHTHTAAGKRVKPDMSEGEGKSVIEPIAALVRRAEAGERLLLLTEW